MELLHNRTLFGARLLDLFEEQKLTITVCDHRLVPVGQGVFVDITESIRVRLLNLEKSLALSLEEFPVASNQIA